MLPTKARLLDALKRGVRAFAQAEAVFFASDQADIWNLHAEKVALISAAFAGASVVWRLVLDPLPIPTLATTKDAAK